MSAGLARNHRIDFWSAIVSPFADRPEHDSALRPPPLRSRVPERVFRQLRPIEAHVGATSLQSELDPDDALPLDERIAWALNRAGYPQLLIEREAVVLSGFVVTAESDGAPGSAGSAVPRSTRCRTAECSSAPTPRGCARPGSTSSTSTIATSRIWCARADGHSSAARRKNVGNQTTWPSELCENGLRPVRCVGEACVQLTVHISPWTSSGMP